MEMLCPACVLYKNIVSQLQYYYSREIKQQLFRFFIFHHVIIIYFLYTPLNHNKNVRKIRDKNNNEDIVEIEKLCYVG